MMHHTTSHQQHHPPVNMNVGHMPRQPHHNIPPPTTGMPQMAHGGMHTRMNNQHHPQQQQQRLAMHQQQIPQNRPNVGALMGGGAPPPTVQQQQPLKSNSNTQRTIPSNAMVNNSNASNSVNSSVNTITNNHQHHPNLQAPPPPIPSQQTQQHLKQSNATAVHQQSLQHPATNEHYVTGGRKTLRSIENVKTHDQIASTTTSIETTNDVSGNVSSTTEEYKINDQLPNTIAIDSLANTKEKTPMCLVNELARYNKIEHQYRLTNEEGPAHKKCFTVTLKLGEEEYTAEGLSIKKAQHAAAGEAISKTKYEHPPLKTNRSVFKTKKIGTLTPTVELNALAMKRGEPTVYVVEPQFGSSNTSNQQIKQNQTNPAYSASTYIPSHSGSSNIANTAAPPPLHQNHQPSNQGNYGGYNNRSNNANFHQSQPYQQQQQQQQQQRYNTGYERKFVGRNGYPNKYDNQRSMYGNNYRQMGPPQDDALSSVTLHVGPRKFGGVGTTLKAARHDAAAKALIVLKPLTPDTTTEEQTISESSTSKLDESSSELKSPISLVHEMALKRKLTVTFKVQSERGPPHMKIFITTCQVGDVVTEGEGNGKKVSKKKAAEKMVDELKKITPPSPSTTENLKQKRKVSIIKKKSRNLIKDKQEESLADEINPISRLIQHQQAKKEKEPTFILVDERGAHKRREFIIEANAGGHTTTGTGPNKKLAKRAAAESLLVLMGISMPSASTSPHPPKPNTRSNKPENAAKPQKKTSSQENGVRSQSSPAKGGSGGRQVVQIVPGALILQPENKNNITSVKATKSSSETTKTTTDSASTKSSTQTSTSKSKDGIRPKDQLMYLASIVGFMVHFSDFPKGNHGEYLTIVTLTTEPQQYCHGAGNSTEASHDQAAATALALLTELGLDNVVPKKTTDD